MKIVFMGTPMFALPSLEEIHKNEQLEVLAVVTQPDRPAGRGKKLQMSPVKQFALENDIKVLQPKRIRKDQECLDYLKSCGADAFVTVAFGQILSKEVLDIPKIGTINVHASLLPELRGPNPIQWSIINGDKKTGITTMLTDVGIDDGDMLLKEECEIPIDMDANELAIEMSNVGAKLLVKTLLGVDNGTIRPQTQDHDKATKAPKLEKDFGKVDWNLPILQIHNIVRGTRPWPGAFVEFQGNILKIHKTQLTESYEKTQELEPGIIIDITKNSIMVTADDGIIEIVEVQPPNKSKMNAGDWARGARIRCGTKLA